MKVGVLGGTFDPVHVGHLIIAEEVRSQLSLEQMIFMPAGQPWLKVDHKVLSAHHRMSMVRIAVASNPQFEVSDMEIRRPGATYTAKTMEELSEKLPNGSRIYFIIGMDAFSNIHLWHTPARIFELCTLVVVERPEVVDMKRNTIDRLYPGAAQSIMFIKTPQVDISGSRLRERVTKGLTIRYLVPPEVEEYIYGQGLYR